MGGSIRILACCLAGLAVAPEALGAGEPEGPGPPLALDPALVMRVPPGGWDELEQAIAALLPVELSLSGLSGEVACADGADPLHYALSGVVFTVSSPVVALAPGEGVLDVEIRLTIEAPSGTLAYGGSCLLPLSEDTCAFAMPPTEVGVSVQVPLVYDDATQDILVPDGGVSIDLDVLPLPNPLDPDDCLLGYLLEAEELFDVPLQETLLGPFLDEALAGLPAELETMLEDTFAQMAIATTVDLGAEQPLEVDVRPSGLSLTAEMGLEIPMSGRVWVEAPASCLEAPATEIVPTPGPTPAFSPEDPSGSRYALAVLLSDDLVNQLLLAAYRSGLFCMELDGVVTVALLSLVVPEVSGFADDALDDVRIGVRPQAAPMGTFSGDPDALVHLAGLGVDAYVPAQARWARAFGLDVSATARLDLDYTEGVLTPALAIDDTDIVATATYLEPFPSAEAALESSFPGLMAVALESFLGADLLPALPIPAVQGLTLADLRFFAEGEGQWLGAYAGLDSSGAVPIEVDLATACAGGGCDAGCGGDGGCGAGCDEGCAGTCDQARRHPAPAGGVLAMGSGLLTGLAVRRRRGR